MDITNFNFEFPSIKQVMDICKQKKSLIFKLCRITRYHIGNKLCERFINVDETSWRGALGICSLFIKIIIILITTVKKYQIYNQQIWQPVSN